MNVTIKKLRVGNFRCLRKAELELAPITLLTGANSSGKSSLMYSILCATQTEYPNLFPFTIAPNGEFCNLGSYTTIVFNQDPKNQVSIGFDIETESRGKASTTKIDATYRFGPRFKQPKVANLTVCSEKDSLEVYWEEIKRKYSIEFRTELREIQEQMQVIGDSFLTLIKEVADRGEEGKKLAKTWIKEWEKKGYLSSIQDRLPWESSALDFSNFPAARKSLEENVYFIQQLNSLKEVVESTQDSIQFVGPARLYPDRIYQDRSATFARMGSVGENYVNILANWKDTRSPKLREVMRTISFLKLAENLSPRKDRQGFIQMLVKVGKKSPIVNIRDVGFGISQILPIIVANEYLTKGGTLLVSQPELHLHPSAQAEMGNYFVQKMNSQNRKYIIETHSEYLLNRFRLIVAKGEISPDEIIIYHMTPRNDSFVPLPIRISKDGQMKGAPRDYFDTYRADVFNLALEV